jgi:APA family basic amino acid/polyamine antiporter
MKKELRLFDLTMIVVSFVLGMGIFRTPVNVAAATSTPFIFYLCWLAGGLVALSGALTYAEIGSRMPVTGGYYKVFAQAYHPSIAFAINGIILVSNAASLAAVALVGSEYIVSVLIPAAKHIHLNLPATAANIKGMQVTVAIVCIIIFYFINLLGLKMSSKTQNVLMAIKIGLVVMLILPLFFSGDSGTATVATVSLTKNISPTMMEYIKAFGIGLVAVSFSYGGYQQTINFGEEVKNPNKNIPRGIFLATAIIITLYMLVNYAYVKVIGFEELKTSKNIAAIMASKIFGPRADVILSVLLFLGVLAYINGSLLSNPRVMYAMSKDEILPPSFSKQNNNGALSLALSLFAGVAVIVVFWAEEFDRILSFTIFLDCFGMALSAASIFVLRRRTKHLDKTGIYKMKLYPLLPVIFIINYIFVAIAIASDYKNNNHAALTGISVLAVFMIIYFIFYRKKKISREL